MGDAGYTLTAEEERLCEQVLYELLRHDEAYSAWTELPCYKNAYAAAFAEIDEDALGRFLDLRAMRMLGGAGIEAEQYCQHFKENVCRLLPETKDWTDEWYYRDDFYNRLREEYDFTCFDSFYASFTPIMEAMEKSYYGKADRAADEARIPELPEALAAKIWPAETEK